MGRNTGLSGETRRWVCAAWLPSTPLEVEQESGQYDVRILKAIHNCDAVLPENLTGIRHGLAGDQQNRRIGMFMCEVDKLPGTRGIRAPLEFDSDTSAGSGESQGGIGFMIGPGAARYHGVPRDPPQYVQSLWIERPLEIHNFLLLQCVCESGYFREWQAIATFSSGTSGRGRSADLTR